MTGSDPYLNQAAVNNMLSISTLIIFMAIIHIICAVVLMFLWVQNRSRFQGTGLWAVNYALKAAGLMLIVMRGTIPLWMATVFATTLFVAGEIILYHGLAAFLQLRVRQLHNMALLALYAIVHGYFSLISASLATRNLILAGAWLFIGMQSVWLLFVRIKPEFRLLTLSTGISVAFYCVINMARIVEYFIYPNPKENYMESGMFEAVILISFQVSAILLTYSLSLMVNKRLTMEIESQEEKYSKAFHASPYALLLTRRCDGKIFEANTGFEKLSGYSINDVLGKTTVELDLFFDIEARDEILGELGRNGSVRDREMKFRIKSGDIRIGLYSAELIQINHQPCVISIISDITGRKTAEEEREKLIKDLGCALSEIRTLGGMLPICSSCKKIRNDSGYWQQIESYLNEHSGTEFSHSLCPDCVRKLYPDMAEGIINEKNRSR